MQGENVTVSDDLSPAQTFQTEIRIRISNNAPTDIQLNTEATPPEAAHTFIPIGQLTASDIDYNDIHNFHLERASDDRFLLINDFVYSKTALDTTDLSQYSLTIQVTDLGGLSTEKTLSLDLQDSDSDGFLDTDEVAAGSDPLDPMSTPIGTFANVKELGAGWKMLDWFGFFHCDNYPWIYHSSLGWVFPVEDTATSLWLWHQEMGWMWTDSTSFPRLFHSNTQSWVHISDSGVFQRWNETTQSWEAF